MLRRNNLVVVGLTTFNTEMLKISVSALARIKSKFTLIIYNDNPADTVTARDIRKIGYHGGLHIINSDKTVGLRAARMRILDTVPTHAQWIIYVNDDDILLSTDIPMVHENNFAVIHSSMIIRRRVSDLILAASHPEKISPDGENIILASPNIGMCGTAIRIGVMRGAANVMHAAAANLDAMDIQLGTQAPVDAVMWMALNKYARMTYPDVAPIFMDSVNYIHNGIGTDRCKNSRADATRRMVNIMTEYEAAIAAAMAAC